MADDQGKLAATRAITHRNPQISGLPGFDWHPGVKLAVVETYFTGVIDDYPAVVGIAVRVRFHDSDLAPELVPPAR